MTLIEAKDCIVDMIFEGVPVRGELYRLPDPEQEALKTAVSAFVYLIYREEVVPHESGNK